MAGIEILFEEAYKFSIFLGHTTLHAEQIISGMSIYDTGNRMPRVNNLHDFGKNCIFVLL